MAKRRKSQKIPESFTVTMPDKFKFKIKRTKQEQIACETERDFSHQSSEQITSSLIVLACEQSELEKELMRLTLSVTTARHKQKFLEAKRAGLNAILNKRNDSC